MRKMKNSQILVFVLLAVLMLAALGCSSAEIPDSPASPNSSDSLDPLDQHGVNMEGSDDKSETAPEGDGQAGSSLGSDAGNDSKPTTNPKLSTNPKDEKTLTCTYSISCATIFDNLDKISEAVLGLQPKDGWIFSPTKIGFEEGESVFDILLRLSRQEKIHMEFNSNPALKSKYVEGINNLYEFDVGQLSGWTYKINGKGMGYGSSSSYPKDGDTIEWLYTCDQGRDLGFEP